MKSFFLIFSFFTFFISIGLIGSQLSFLINNYNMIFSINDFEKKRVLIDSFLVEQHSAKGGSYSSIYGFSKTLDNYQTKFNLNTPDGSALIENKIEVSSEIDSINENNVWYFSWVDKSKNKGYICNLSEKSIQENWYFLNEILELKFTIVLILFTTIVFYWLEVYKLFK